jgi:hypothetical protein
VARKEDGFYIDPRTNGGINIEAITLDDVVITDGNGSVISRHAKRQNDASGEHTGEKTEQFAEESQDEGKTDDNKEDDRVTGEGNLSEGKTTRRRRREVAASKDNDGNDSQKSDVQSVSILRKKNIYIHLFSEKVSKTANIW